MMDRKLVLLLIIVSSCAPALAQDTPKLPEITLRDSVHAPVRDTAVFQPKYAHAADRRFWIFTAIHASLMVSDAELTYHCVTSYPLTCREANPILGPHPGRGRLYGIGLASVGAETLISFALKRHHPTGKMWLLPPIVGSVAHGIGTAVGIRANINAPRLYR
jgi:hypothetical protein